MPESRQRKTRGSADRRRRRTRALARGYLKVLATKDVSAFLQAQREAGKRFCGECSGRIVRKGERIECRRCGRSMSVEAYAAREDAARVREEAVSESPAGQEGAPALAAEPAEVVAV